MTSLEIGGTGLVIVDANVLLRSERAASAQKFTLWQQATIEVTRCDHSVISCSCLIWVLLFAHIPFVVNRAFSATPAERLQQCYEKEGHSSFWCNLELSGKRTITNAVFGGAVTLCLCVFQVHASSTLVRHVLSEG